MAKPKVKQMAIKRKPTIGNKIVTNLANLGSVLFGKGKK